MLSYRHSFHAGNFADVIKHVVLIEILEHLTRKDKSFNYIDTHAGAGLFDLSSADARKLHEHKMGIGKLVPAEFPELARYFEIIRSCNPSDEVVFYPGSPSIAKYFLRPQDRAWLYELHPREYDSLCENMGKDQRLRTFFEDGLKRFHALLPPASRRALVLLDPSYEIKSDYEEVFNAVAKAHKKFSTGIYAIWYPVVDRNTIDTLERKFMQSDIKNIQRYELGISPDTAGRGMTASGMIVINPPWTLFSTMTEILPRLASTLGPGNDPIFRCDVLAGE